MQAQLDAVETIRDTLPGSIIVGDSTQPVYAANLYYDHDRPGGWFNAATGFGALGYGPPAAIGAALAMPDATVVCLSGDGGFQFSLPELAAAVDAGAPVIFVVWNNLGYREIETSMREVGVEPVGVSPAPPDFAKIAEAYGIAAERLASPCRPAGRAAACAGDEEALSHRDRGGLRRWAAEFAGRTVVVTGGTGALGGAVLARLLDEGAICHVPTSHASAPKDFAFAKHDRVKLALECRPRRCGIGRRVLCVRSRPLGVDPLRRRICHVADRRQRLRTCLPR